jgi:hypothetical protein
MKDKPSEFEGSHATLKVYDDHIEIQRSGLIALGSLHEKYGKKTIPIDEITGVDYDKMIRIKQRGHTFPRSSVKRDLNTIAPKFTQDSAKLAKQIEEAIMSRK